MLTKTIMSYIIILVTEEVTRKCASGSVGGARPCQGRGRGFESRLALFLFSQRERVIRWIALSFCERRALEGSSNVRVLRFAPVGSKPRSPGPCATSRADGFMVGLWPQSLLRSVQDRRPLDVVKSSLRSGRFKTDVHWTS